jgi:Beta-lactamase enzyme family
MQTPFFNRFRRCALIALTTISAFATAEDYNGNLTGHLIYRHSTSQIKAMIADGWRPTSIGYESSVNGAGYFRVAYVQNTGSHYKECRFEGDATEASIQAVRNAGWRIEDIEFQGASRFAGIFIRNSVNPRTTLWFAGHTAQSVANWLQANPTYRLLEIDRSGTGANERFSGVYIRNTGAGYVSGSGWYTDATLTTILNWADANDMRVVDLDQGDTGRYAAVLEKGLPGQRYYCFSAASMTRCLEILEGMGLRAVQINPRISNGQLTYTMTTVNNANAQSARLADFCFPNHNGYQGFYVQRVGSVTTDVGLNHQRSFYPSSAIKTLIHYTGAATTATTSLNTRLISGQTMLSRHRNMMFNSDNPDSNLLMLTYTIPTIESYAHSSLGMSQVTQLNNQFGFGGPYGDPPYNATTLVDMGKLYSAIRGNFLGVTKSNWLMTNMKNQGTSDEFDSTFTDERTRVGLSATEYSDWRSRVLYIYKGGNSADPNSGANGYWTVCGVMTLPFKGGSLIANRPYLFGHFVNRSTEDYSGFATMRELLREQIRASMQTFNQ